MTSGPEQKMSPDEALSQISKNLDALQEVADNFGEIFLAVTPDFAPELWAFTLRYQRLIGGIASEAAVDIARPTFLEPHKPITK